MLFNFFLNNWIRDFYWQQLFRKNSRINNEDSFWNTLLKSVSIHLFGLWWHFDKIMWWRVHFVLTTCLFFCCILVACYLLTRVLNNKITTSNLSYYISNLIYLKKTGQARVGYARRGFCRKIGEHKLFLKLAGALPSWTSLELAALIPNFIIFYGYYFLKFNHKFIVFRFFFLK